jgi:hypothetical protein
MPVHTPQRWPVGGNLELWVKAMFAFKSFGSVWRFFFGPESKRTERRFETAAHLRSLDMATFAHLMGHGSRPGCGVIAEPVAALESAPAVIDTSLPAATAHALPWPLLRNSGVFEFEHHKTAIALAASAALLALDMREKAHAASARNADADSFEPAAVPALAAKLAAVARHNQPAGRSSRSGALKDAAHRASERALVQRTKARMTKPGLRDTRTQAVVIDFASVRTARRNGTLIRAA